MKRIKKNEKYIKKKKKDIDYLYKFIYIFI